MQETNSLHVEGTVNIADVPSVNISLRECVGKASLFGGQGYRRYNCKTLCRSNLSSCRKSNKLCKSKCHNSLSCKNKWHLFWHHHVLHFFCFVFLFFLLLADVMKNYFCLFPCIRFWSTCKQFTTFANRIRRFYTFLKRKQSLYIFTGYYDK